MLLLVWIPVRRQWVLQQTAENQLTFYSSLAPWAKSTSARTRVLQLEPAGQRIGEAFTRFSHSHGLNLYVSPEQQLLEIWVQIRLMVHRIWHRIGTQVRRDSNDKPHLHEPHAFYTQELPRHTGILGGDIRAGTRGTRSPVELNLPGSSQPTRRSAPMVGQLANAQIHQWAGAPFGGTWYTVREGPNHPGARHWHVKSTGREQRNDSS